jgi:hypothetical protein
MKHTILFIIAFFCFSSIYAQVDSSDMPVPADAPAVAPTPPTTAAPPARANAVRPAPRAAEMVKGNAGKDVSIVPATGTACANNLSPIGIVNKCTNSRAIIALVEVTTVFSGHASKKQIRVDNVAPNETRYIGCSGCIKSPTGQTCTTYKILAAIYK